MEESTVCAACYGGDSLSYPRPLAVLTILVSLIHMEGTH